MAGIGFELKKIFKEQSIINTLKGAIYSMFTVVGPMLIVIIGFFVLNIIMDYQSISYADKDLIVSIILYVFIFSLIFTSPLSAIISRYVADKIFDEQTEDVMPCYYTGLVINLLIALAFCIPFAVIAVIKNGIDPIIMFSGGCMFFALFLVFYTLTFVSALKEYKSIVINFAIGIIIMIATAYFLKSVLHIGYVISVTSGAAVGFLTIAFVLFALVKRFFNLSSNNYRGLLQCIKRHIPLFLTNLCYIMGLYIHNFIYWYYSDLGIIVDQTFRSAPTYDTATFLAMLTNVSAMVVYTVRVEINFHDRYQVYCQELLGGLGDDIDRAEKNMFSTLVKELSYMVQIQLILSVVIFLVVMIFGPSFGFGGLCLNIYPALAAGYFALFIMYGTIIFLYYFNDGSGAFISSLMFFITTAAVSFFSTLLPPSFYGIGPFCGAFAGWTTAFFRLRYIQKNLSTHIFCRGNVINKTYVSKRNKENIDAIKTPVTLLAEARVDAPILKAPVREYDDATVPDWPTQSTETPKPPETAKPVPEQKLPKTNISIKKEYAASMSSLSDRLAVKPMAIETAPGHEAPEPKAVPKAAIIPEVTPEPKAVPKAAIIPEVTPEPKVVLKAASVPEDELTNAYDMLESLLAEYMESELGSPDVYEPISETREAEISKAGAKHMRKKQSVATGGYKNVKSDKNMMLGISVAVACGVLTVVRTMSKKGKK